LQEVGNVIFGMKALELHSEWMFGVFGQFDACLFMMHLQGGVEKLPEASRLWLLSHLKDGEETGSSGGGVGSLGGNDGETRVSGQEVGRGLARRPSAPPYYHY
jgi:hypothetical protein